MNHDSFWHSLAACKGMAAENFYPPLPGGQVTAAAVAACDRCPVRRECAEWAIAHEDRGYWAGMSANRRRAIRKRDGIDLDTPEAVNRAAHS